MTARVSGASAAVSARARKIAYDSSSMGWMTRLTGLDSLGWGSLVSLALFSLALFR